MSAGIPSSEFPSSPRNSTSFDSRGRRTSITKNGVTTRRSSFISPRQPLAPVIQITSTPSYNSEVPPSASNDDDDMSSNSSFSECDSFDGSFSRVDLAGEVWCVQKELTYIPCSGQRKETSNAGDKYNMTLPPKNSGNGVEVPGYDWRIASTSASSNAMVSKHNGSIASTPLSSEAEVTENDGTIAISSSSSNAEVPGKGKDGSIASSNSPRSSHGILKKRQFDVYSSSGSIISEESARSESLSSDATMSHAGAKQGVVEADVSSNAIGCSSDGSTLETVSSSTGDDGAKSKKTNRGFVDEYKWQSFRWARKWIFQIPFF